MAHPTFFTIRRNNELSGVVLYPGIDSNLSRVPPVCPKPRPEIIGVYIPQDATMGANIMLTLSPTPPVECLSTTGPFKSFQFNLSPDFTIWSVRKKVSSVDIPLNITAIQKAAIWLSETDPLEMPSI